MPVILRALKTDDAVVSVQWRNNPDIRDNILGYRHPVTEETERAWIKQIIAGEDPNKCVWAIEDNIDKTLVGYAYLTEMDKLNHNAWVGIIIGDTSRHHSGLGRSAVEQLTVIAVQQFQLHKLLVRIVDFNKKSQLFFASLGYKPEGLLKQQIHMEGKYHDLHIMAKILS